MVMPIANIVREHVTANQGKKAMTKIDEVIRYNASLAIFKNWLAEGIINEDEFQRINDLMATKYGLSFSSIFLNKTCYLSRKE